METTNCHSIQGQRQNKCSFVDYPAEGVSVVLSQWYRDSMQTTLFFHFMESACTYEAPR